MISKEDAYAKLLDKRICVLDDDINLQKVEKIMAQMLAMYVEKPDEKIKFVIDSNGGGVTPAFSLYDFISTLPAQIVAYVPKKCHSAAIWALLGCKERIALPHARFKLHSMKATIELYCPDPLGISVEEQIAASVADAKADSVRGEKILLKHLTLDQAQLTEQLKKGQRNNIFLCSDEALPIKLITKICDKSEEWVFA